MNTVRALIALLIFPGLLYALPAGLFMLGLERKWKARFQGRIGPPATQAFYDVIKLLSKSPVSRFASDVPFMIGLPLFAIATTIGALALLPVFSSESGFFGDIIVLVGLLEMPPLAYILAGYASRSIYGEVGSTRDAVVTIVSNVPFLAALIAMASASGSMHSAEIATSTPWMVRIPALIAILLCLPMKLRITPFSLANAEQELLAGPLTEFDGPRLALWELAHALEWSALIGFVVTLAIPYRGASWIVNAAVFVVLSFVLVLLLALLASSTARLKVSQAIGLMWKFGSTVAAIALIVAFFVRGGGL
jgi:NADH-quinone oxidoreductase subunit H